VEFWNNIYSHFDPVAFSIGGFNIHWYGIMYALALLSALWMAQYIVKKDNLDISQNELDSYFLWVEIGVIVGARVGYMVFYSPNTEYYLLHPWQMFNPFVNGVFVGFSGFSFHGAVIGFILATIFYSMKYKKSFWFLVDLAVIAVPFGYIFGRIGNFLNQELFGRATDLSFGIYVDGVLRHPSQLYEAVLEGLLIFVVLYTIRNRKRFNGELAIIYIFLYGIARTIAELFREPDFQLGFICCDIFTMGQLLSFGMIISAVVLYLIMKYKNIGRLN
jgi:phosphatidylglycerol:prolipoprotein diacylglycerol transferase